jgi:hypothetical protein
MSEMSIGGAAMVDEFITMFTPQFQNVCSAVCALAGDEHAVDSAGDGAISGDGAGKLGHGSRSPCHIGWVLFVTIMTEYDQGM